MWIGPNGMDNLAGKIHKFTKQLSMSAFADQLADLNPAAFEKIVLLKGYFFQHIATEIFPHFYNRNVFVGKWLFISELNQVVKPGSKYIIVPKCYWLGFYLDKNLKIINGPKLIETVRAEIERVGKGIMLAELNEAEDLIKKKYMVAPDYWPKIG
jgi:hypothetical protein